MPAKTVPAVLLYFVGGDLVRYETNTDPTMLSPVDAAVAVLREYKAAMVAADAVTEVTDALSAGQATE